MIDAAFKIAAIIIMLLWAILSATDKRKGKTSSAIYDLLWAILLAIVIYS